MLDKTTILSRQMGTLPDWIWYQLNGKTAQENYAEQQRTKSRQFWESVKERRAEKQDADEPLNIVIEGKVKK